MQKNPIKGTSDWKEVSFELDVPNGAETMTFGTVLIGKGHLWVDSMSIEPIGVVMNDKPEEAKVVLSADASFLDFES